MASERTEAQEKAVQDLIDAVKVWREVLCLYAKQSPDGIFDAHCQGDNHLIECPVEHARQDLLAADNKVEQLCRNPHPKGIS